MVSIHINDIHACVCSHNTGTSTITGALTKVTMEFACDHVLGVWNIVQQRKREKFKVQPSEPGGLRHSQIQAQVSMVVCVFDKDVNGRSFCLANSSVHLKPNMQIFSLCPPCSRFKIQRV